MQDRNIKKESVSKSLELEFNLRMFKPWKKKKVKETPTHQVKESSPSIEDKDIPEDESSSDDSDIYESHPLKDDIYGLAIPDETPELIRTKLDELNKELEGISDKKKRPWLKALEKCPELCGDSFRLMFLRCELFIVSPAAQRLLKYWEKRVELFSESKAFLPLKLNQALRDDTTALNIGFLRYTGKQDSTGRAILFLDPTRLPLNESYDRHSLVRAFWYNAHICLGNQVVQRMGATVVVCTKDAKYGHSDRKLLSMTASSLKGCVPLRIAAFQVCYPPTFFDVLYPIFKIAMGARLRKKVKVNSGSEKEVVEQLEKHWGIKKEDLPQQAGGGLILDHKEWLEKRRADGL